MGRNDVFKSLIELKNEIALEPKKNFISIESFIQTELVKSQMTKLSSNRR